MSLQDLAEQYFSKLNPIAKRLYADLNETKAAYDQLWTTLSEEEKEQILNESIIKPEACLQYSLEKDDTQSSTNDYAVKMIVDDNYSYRDEHSAPFSFRTPSQRDLRIFGEIKEPPRITATYKMKKEESANSCDTNALSSNNTSLSTLPKTGLDLLDNW